MSHLYREISGKLSSAESAEEKSGAAPEVLEDANVAARLTAARKKEDETTTTKKKTRFLEQGPQKKAPPGETNTSNNNKVFKKDTIDSSPGVWDDNVSSSFDKTSAAAEQSASTVMEPRYPGAERVRGIDATDSQSDTTHFYQSSLQTTTPSTTTTTTGRPERIHGEQTQELVDAVLVDREEEERVIAARLRAQQKENLPLAEAVRERPWYQRRSFIVIAGLIVVATIATVLAVVLTKDNDDTPVSQQLPPTVSPAPTALAVITTVILLDNRPQQTGWRLECDGDVLGEAGPGSYGIVWLYFLPYFRIEYEAETFVGAECKLTLTDTGGDGLNPGLFEVYYGDNISEKSNRITGGTITSGESTILFVVEAKDDAPDTSAPGPTPSPTVVEEQPDCTVCPDGAPVPFPDAMAAGWGATTCIELEAIAQNANDTTDCESIRSAASSCGCPNFCTTICPDGTSEPDPEQDDTVVFVRNLRQVTCGFFQSEIAASNSNSMVECLSANFLGEDVCGCPPTEDFCHLCLNETNPLPEDLEREIIPGLNCRDLTGIAYTLRPSDPSGIFFEICPACLGIGAYCGCEIPNPQEREFCRLCGGNDNLLPEPARLVESAILNQTTTCFHVEFAANIANPDTFPCSVYQEDSALDCCF